MAVPPRPITESDIAQISNLGDLTQARAAVMTFVSLMVAVVTLGATIVRLLSAHDFVNLWLLLQDQGTLATVAALVGTGWTIWRVTHSYQKQGVVQKAVAAPPLAEMQPPTPPR